MTDPNPRYNVTYTDAVLVPEKPPITEEMMRRYWELDREETIAKLRRLDILLGRKQTIPRRVR